MDAIFRRLSRTCLSDLIHSWAKLCSKLFRLLIQRRRHRHQKCPGNCAPFEPSRKKADDGEIADNIKFHDFRIRLYSILSGTFTQCSPIAYCISAVFFGPRILVMRNSCIRKKSIITSFNGFFLRSARQLAPK